MLVFTEEEKTDLINFMSARQSFQDFRTELAVDEQQMLASLDFERKIWWLFFKKCTCEFKFKEFVSTISTQWSEICSIEFGSWSKINWGWNSKLPGIGKPANLCADR